MMLSLLKRGEMSETSATNAGMEVTEDGSTIVTTCTVQPGPGISCK